MVAPRRQPTPAELDLAVETYVRERKPLNYTRRLIHRRCGQPVTAQVLSRWLKEAGFKIRRSASRKSYEESVVRDLAVMFYYRLGFSLLETGRAFGLTDTFVHRILVRLGEPRRPQGVPGVATWSKLDRQVQERIDANPDHEPRRNFQNRGLRF